VSEPERVTVAVGGGVADVRLNRPEKINALDPPLIDALAATAARLGADRSVRAVVLSGAGRGFCSGLDLEAIAAMGGRDPATTRLGDRIEGSIANRAQLAAYAWTALPVPVIAAIHGVAVGGGAQIALAADIRVMAPGARIAILEIRWGLVPDMTGTAVLPRLVGLDVAKELTWTGRMVQGEEAVRLGLATRLADDPHAEALALAADIAGRNPHAVRAAKRLLEQSGRVPLAEQLLAESQEMGKLIASPNQSEAVQAYMEKRQPVFTDPG
jgi:enoyl-CoA hydratase/carnithine racemase